jgi:ATP diphosphatase
MGEVKRALKSGNKSHLKEEIGDLLQAVTALAYFSGVDPEEALHGAGDKFTARLRKSKKGCIRGLRKKR